MKTIKTISSAIGFITLFSVLFAAILLLIKNPYTYINQTNLVIHIFGLCILVVILAFKISDYAGIFLNPHKSLFFTIIQLILLPFVISFLVNHFQLPYTFALAIGCAALSPGNMAKNFFKNIFLAACVFFVSIYILPTSSTTVNQIYTTTTSSHTKTILLVIALVFFACYEIHHFIQNKNNQPDEVYYIQEK